MINNIYCLEFLFFQSIFNFLVRNEIYIVNTYENNLVLHGYILLINFLYQYRLHLMLDLEYTNLYFRNLH